MGSELRDELGPAVQNNFSGIQWREKISLMNICAVSLSEKVFEQGKNSAILEKSSTTTIIVSCPLQRGSEVMKSILRYAHGPDGC